MMLIQKSDDLLYYINGLQRRTLLLKQSNSLFRHINIKILQSYNNKEDEDDLSDSLALMCCCLIGEET